MVNVLFEKLKLHYKTFKRKRNMTSFVVLMTKGNYYLPIHKR